MIQKCLSDGACMTLDDVENISWLQAQKLKYQELFEHEKKTALRVLYRRMTVSYTRRINKILNHEEK